MPEFIAKHLTEILLAIVAAGVAITVTLTIRYINNSRKNSNNDSAKTRVKQSGNIVGGDQAGRDINKR